LLVASSRAPKIEEVDSKSKVTTPKYKIIREPPEGRPEFLVIEIALHGVVSIKDYYHYYYYYYYYCYYYYYYYYYYYFHARLNRQSICKCNKIKKINKSTFLLSESGTKNILLRFGLLLPLWGFSTLGNYYFEVSFNVKVILLDQKNE